MHHGDAVYRCQAVLLAIGQQEGSICRIGDVLQSYSDVIARLPYTHKLLCACSHSCNKTERREDDSFHVSLSDLLSL